MDYDAYFTVNVTTKSRDRVILGKSDGTPVEMPEGFGLAGKFSAINPEYIYPDIIETLQILRHINNVGNRNIERYNEIISQLKLENKSHSDKSITWDNRIGKLQHKLESLKYHMNNFKKHETEIENKYKNKYTNTITNFEELDPIFAYETEAFLFQTKSSLDILGQIIGLALKLSGIVTYGDNGKDLIDKIQKTSSFRDFEHDKELLVKIIRENINWVSYLVNMRDLITHFSDLINFQSHVHQASFSQSAKIYYPRMPDDKRVIQYMDETWQNLVNIINEISLVLRDLYNKVYQK